MNPRVRVALAVSGVLAVIVFVFLQVYLIVLVPLLQWRRERAEDRAAYQDIARKQTRAEIEQALVGWRAERLEGTPYCDLLVKRRAPESDRCKAADHEVTYQRRRTVQHDAPLTPLKILVIYDRGDRVVTANTLD
jgi:hypothetical protein